MLAGVSPGPRDLAPSQQGVRCSSAPPTQKEMQAGTRRTRSRRPQLCFEMASKEEEEARRIEGGRFESSRAVARSTLWKRTVRAREDLRASALDFLSSAALRTRERGEETGESYEVLTNELERISRDPPDTKRGQEGPPILRSLKQRMTPIKMCKVCYYTDGLESRRQKWERSVWGSKEGKEGRDSSVAAGTRQKRLILPHNSSKVKEVRDRLMIHNLAGWQAKY